MFSAGDFFFSADDFLEIEIYYNKRKFSELQKEKELSLNISLAEAAAWSRYFLSRSELSLALASGKLSRELLEKFLVELIYRSWISLPMKRDLFSLLRKKNFSFKKEDLFSL